MGGGGGADGAGGDRWIDGYTRCMNETTGRCKPIYSPFFSKQGYKNSLFKIWKERKLDKYREE